MIYLVYLLSLMVYFFCFFFFFFFFNDTATTEIYTLSLHDALPISPVAQPARIAAVSRPPAPGTSPRSRPPTRAAALCSTLKPFQPSRTILALSASLRASARIAAPSDRASAPCPRISIGLLAALRVSAQPCRPATSSASVSGPRPSDVTGKVRSSAGPTDATLNPPCSQRLRSRALTIAASTRGLLPMRRQASARSIPAMVVLKRYPARQEGSSAAPSCRQSRCGEPSAAIRSLSASIASQSTRSPAMAAILLPGTPLRRPAIEAKASLQSTSTRRPSRRR